MRFLWTILVSLHVSLTVLASDPFERTLTMGRESKYAGQELSLDSTRNLIEMSPEQIVQYGFAQATEQIDSQYRYVANFRHEDRYWVAKIPKTGVQEAILQFQTLTFLDKMGVPDFIINWLRLGHIQIRFRMQPGSSLELRTQNLREPQQIRLIDDFSYALNAVRVKGQEDEVYQPFGDGIKKGYGLAHTFISTLDTIEVNKRNNRSVEQYKLNFNSKRRNKLLKAYIDMSVNGIETEAYHTITASCVTETMQGIYTAAPNRPVLWYLRFWRNWRLYKQFQNLRYEFNPRAVISVLTKQNYITENGQMKNLEVEFANRRPNSVSTCRDYIDRE